MATSPHPLRPLAALVVVFMLLSLLYNWASPLFENSDEFFHFPLVKYLADTNGSLPVQSPQDLQDWRQQGNQPPAYHLLAALLIKPFDTSDYAQVRRINPHAQLGVVGESNINAVLHPLNRSKEFQGGTAWALRLTRFFSTILAGIVVVCAYFMTIYTFPQVPRWVGLLAAALVAFNPMFLFVSASVNNDNLSNAMISLVLVLMVWLYRRQEKPPGRVLLIIGVCLGISLLSKLSTGPFMLLVGLFWLLLAYKHQAWRYMIQGGVVMLGIAVLVSGWWYIRNYDLYGDPTGLDMFLDIVGRRAIPLTSEQLWSERIGFMQSFWGMFGGMTIPMSEGVYWGFNILCGLSVVGVSVYFLIRTQISKDWHKLDFPQAALFLWLMMSFISLVRWTALTWASQGRLWFIALTALAALSAVGFYELGRRVKVPALAWLPVLYALAVAIIAPFAWIRPAYAVPSFTSIADYPQPLTTFSDPQHPNETIRLINASFPDAVRTGQMAQIDLTFCAETALSRDWSVFVHLVNQWDIILAQADFTPGNGALPTSEIAAGKCWQDRYPVKIPAGIASTDTDLTLLVGFYDVRDNTRMNYAPGEDRYVVQPTHLEVGDALQKFTLGDAVRIADYKLSDAVVKAGDELTLTVHWEVLQPLKGDYTVFVQVLEPLSSYRAGASDKAPEGGTAAWQRGDFMTDTHTFSIAPDAPAGVYAVIVGFYQQAEDGSFQRLRLAYEGVDTGFDYITLTQVKVE